MSIALFTVVDLETTGLAPPASVIEVGVTRLYLDTESKAVEIAPTETRLFSPKSYGELTPENVAVHHLTRDMLAGFEPCSDEALAAIIQRDHPQFVVAANWAFEAQWLDRAEILGADLGGKAPRAICTVKGAARLYPDAPKYLPRVPFGKHKGAEWSAVPEDYLTWCCKQTNMDADVIHAVQVEIQRRQGEAA